jgi:hypothetical protein
MTITDPHERILAQPGMPLRIICLEQPSNYTQLVVVRYRFQLAIQRELFHKDMPPGNARMQLPFIVDG